MQPNDQQGLNQPGQGQPVPATPPQPPVASPAPSPNPPIAPLPAAAPALDTAAVQAALDEPIPATQPVPAAPLGNPAAPQSVAAEEPIDDQANDGGPEDDANLQEPVTWVAHEYIPQEKGTMWFTLFGIVVVVLIAVSIFFMHSWSFAILMAVIAVVVVVYSRRPPRELTYSLNDEGLSVDGKIYKFEQFKSFGIIRDGEHFSVMLIPTQRFQPGVTIYFPEEAGEDIVDVLGSRLPMKDLKLDAVDRVVRLLRL